MLNIFLYAVVMAFVVVLKLVSVSCSNGAVIMCVS